MTESILELRNGFFPNSSLAISRQLLTQNDEVCHRRELTSSVFKQNLVIKAQAQLRHSRQEHAHLNGAHDLAAQNITIGTNLKK